MKFFLKTLTLIAVLISTDLAISEEITESNVDAYLECVATHGGALSDECVWAFNNEVRICNKSAADMERCRKEAKEKLDLCENLAWVRAHGQCAYLLFPDQL